MHHRELSPSCQSHADYASRPGRVISHFALARASEKEKHSMRRETSASGEGSDMYARVSTYEGSTEDYDAGVEKMTSDIAPQVRAMAGSAGLLTMVDRNTGQSLSITLWDSEDAMVNSRDAANRVRSQAATSTGSTIVNVAEYEVGVADLA